MKGSVFFLVALIVFAIFLIGGFNFGNLSGPDSGGTVYATCCDTGDGNACKPQTGIGQTLTYNGSQYGLIKAKVNLIEGNAHLEDSGEKVNGNPIIINSSNVDNTSFNDLTTQGYKTYCNATSNDDTYFKTVPSDADKAYLNKEVPEPIFVHLLQTYCTPIPNDELVFVCKKNCHPVSCSTVGSHCYGDDNSVYDVYYRLADLSTNGIPDFIKNCAKVPVTNPTREVVPVLPTGQRQNLQLETLGFGTQTINPGLSPFCKPAIYLYPKTTTNVNVKVEPVGPISYSIPPYPSSGWNVTANPSGQILAQNENYDYLYYEAQIPDTKIEKPSTGFVVKKSGVKGLLENILPELGLKPHEESQFVSYWSKKLPASPYYFVGVVSRSNLDSIAPLDINPKPDSIIRVDLYFQALDKFEKVAAPTLAPVSRKGFTVVEWGGIIKLHKNQPFTCMM